MQTGHSGRNRLVAIVIVLATIVAAGAIWARADDGPAPSRAASAPESVPWPGPLEPVATRVERLRGLRFRRPVSVRYRHATTGPTRLSASQEQVLRDSLQPLAVFGLVDPSADLGPLVQGGGVAGEYSLAHPGIRIYAGRADPGTDVVVAHELTHALEDQRFPADERPEPKNHAQAVAQQMTIEGSATLVEQRYLASEWPPPLRSPSGAVDTPTTDLSAFEYLATASAIPYVIGPASLDALIERGERTWDEIVANPPLSDAVFADPLVPPGSLWSGTRPQGAPAAAARDVVAPSALETYLILASRIDPATALEVVRRTSSASSGFAVRDGRLCGDLTLVTPAGDDAVVGAALDEWVAVAGAPAGRMTIPASTSTIVLPPRTPDGTTTSQQIPRAGAQVLTSCVGLAAAPYGSFLLPAELLALRSTAIAEGLRGDLSAEALDCVGDAVLADQELRTGLRGSLESSTSFDPRDADRAVRRALRSCRASA